jgi:microcystin-dependent protein
MGLIYPVGSVYINVSDNTNPGTLLGVGTWTALGAGRMIVGYDAGDTSFDSAGETGGANTVTLTTTELPAHTHNINAANHNGWAGTAQYVQGSESTLQGSDIVTESTGSGSAFSVLNKYVTCYTWKRTA